MAQPWQWVQWWLWCIDQIPSLQTGMAFSLPCFFQVHLKQGMDNSILVKKKESNIKMNEGSVDRIICAIIGITFVTLGLLGVASGVWM